MTSSPEAPTKAIGTGRSGRVRAALDKVLADARRSERMTLEHELRAIIAQRQASLCDDYAAQGKGPEMLKASDALLTLLDTLPIRSTGGGEGPLGDSGSGRAKLVSVLDSSPAVGDSAHA